MLIFENYPFEATLRGWEGGIEVRQVKTFERSNYPLNLIVIPRRSRALDHAVSQRFVRCGQGRADARSIREFDTKH